MKNASRQVIDCEEEEAVEEAATDMWESENIPCCLINVTHGDGVIGS